MCCIVIEPTVFITLITPREYYGAMVEVIKERRGVDITIQYLEDGNVLITAVVPWQEVVCDMNNKVIINYLIYHNLSY